jgi:hypothetical protein
MVGSCGSGGRQSCCPVFRSSNVSPHCTFANYPLLIDGRPPTLGTHESQRYTFVKNVRFTLTSYRFDSYYRKPSEAKIQVEMLPHPSFEHVRELGPIRDANDVQVFHLTFGPIPTYAQFELDAEHILLVRVADPGGSLTVHRRRRSHVWFTPEEEVHARANATAWQTFMKRRHVLLPGDRVRREDELDVPIIGTMDRLVSNTPCESAFKARCICALCVCVLKERDRERKRDDLMTRKQEGKEVRLLRLVTKTCRECVFLDKLYQGDGTISRSSHVLPGSICRFTWMLPLTIFHITSTESPDSIRNMHGPCVLWFLKAASLVSVTLRS